MQVSHLLLLSFFLLFVISLFTALIIYGMRRFNRHRAAWRDFGAGLGLQPEPRWSRFDNLKGMLDEFPLTLIAQGTQQGKHQDTNHLQIDAALELPGLPEKIAVYRETFATKLGKLFRTQDIEVGDQGFDQAFKVKGKEPEMVKMYLLSNGRTQTFQNLAQGPLAAVILTAPGLKLHLDARLNQPAELEAVRAALGQLGELARALQ